MVGPSELLDPIPGLFANKVGVSVGIRSPCIVVVVDRFCQQRRPSHRHWQSGRRGGVEKAQTVVGGDKGERIRSCPGPRRSHTNDPADLSNGKLPNKHQHKNCTNGGPVRGVMDRRDRVGDRRRRWDRAAFPLETNGRPLRALLRRVMMTQYNMYWWYDDNKAWMMLSGWSRVLTTTQYEPFSVEKKAQTTTTL